MKHGPWPGNTSIVKLQDTLIGGSLTTWAANIVLDALIEQRGMPISNEALRSLAHSQVNRAQRIGTEVHEQVAMILQGGHAKVTPTKETAPYLYAYTAFLAAERPEYLAVEQRVIHAKAQYGGTLDFIAKMPRFPKQIVLGDIKTGKAKESHRLQLAGYMAAEGFGGEIDQYHRYWYDDAKALRPIPRITRCVLLYLRPDGYELVPVDVTAADRRHFLYLAGAYHRLRAWQASLNGKDPT